MGLGIPAKVDEADEPLLRVLCNEKLIAAKKGFCQDPQIPSDDRAI
jgi:hypothetical protein